MATPAWKSYEIQILETLRDKFSECIISPNQKKLGIYSDTLRQIDILVEGTMVGHNIFGVVECKCFNKKVDVKTVESFLGFLDDVGANLGIMITNKGYSKAAEKRAKQKDVRLQIVEFKKLDSYDFFYDWCDCDRGVIRWGREMVAESRGQKYLIEEGCCEYCAEEYFRCSKCGHIQNMEIADDAIECYCGYEFIVEGEYDGSGSTEHVVYLLNKKHKSKFKYKKELRTYEDDFDI